MEARADLDIMSPAPRILELRARGWDIITVWDELPDSRGRVRRVGRYVLRGTAPRVPTVPGGFRFRRGVEP